MTQLTQELGNYGIVLGKYPTHFCVIMLVIVIYLLEVWNLLPYCVVYSSQLLHVLMNTTDWPLSIIKGGFS